MENEGGDVADGGVLEPPEGVVQCEGIPRKSWMTKCVALQNDAGVVVGREICHNVDSFLIIDSDNQPLGDDRVAVQIAESLSERDVPSDWVFQLKAWHISRVCRTPCKCLLFDSFLSMEETAGKSLTLHSQGSRCTNPTWATPM